MMSKSLLTPATLRHTLSRLYSGGKGQGIVIIGGGAYLPSAYIAIRHLRSLGCGLPIQLWCLNSAEIPPFWSKISSPLEVETVDARRIEFANDFPRLGGYECKVHAIVSCPFEQVLLLDADNIPLQNPAFLFESPQLAAYGQVFWPDFLYPPGHKFAIRSRAWADLKLPPQNGIELESGQLLIDRKRWWENLQISRAMNVASTQVYNNWTWGDKDTFTLAWELGGKPYYVVPHRPRFIDAGHDTVLWQHSFDGSRLFQHQRKWFAPPEQMKDLLLPGEQLTEQSLGYLHEFWRAAANAGISAIPTPQAQRTLVREKSESNPKDAREWLKRGIKALADGQPSTAVKQASQAVALDPNNAGFRIDLAAILCQANRPAEAIPHLLKALSLRRNLPDVHNNMGVALEQLERYEEATAAFENAARLEPSRLTGQLNLGRLQRKCGTPAKSLETFCAALRQDADCTHGYDGVVNATDDLGDAKTKIDAIRQLLRLKPQSPHLRSSYLYELHYLPGMDRKTLFGEHREWDRRFGNPSSVTARDDRRPYANRRIRVGYVSPDFRHHTVPKFIGGVLAHHDRDRFEVFCYSDTSQEDHVSRQFRAWAEHWRDIVGLPDHRAKQIIEDDQIDILVDLRGHAASNRLTLFAKRVAPIQINMVGYFDTTGLAAMDYHLTDSHQDPAGLAEQYHTERLLRMPVSCWCYRPDDQTPDVNEPPCNSSSHVTFGSVNKIIKVSEPCARLWSRVLERVPNSRLLLIAVSENAADSIRSLFSKFGLPPKRVDFDIKCANYHDYLERFGKIDIALDTSPFSGITTTCDGLWMGVPLVSCGGDIAVSRAGTSILHGAGLQELAAQTEEQFVDLAVDLAGDQQRLRELRLAMRDRMRTSALMNAVQFTQQLETHYQSAWQRWLQSH
jgi:protein O-GlcNAc transferase